MTAEIIDIQPFLDMTFRKGDIVEIEGKKYKVTKDVNYKEADLGGIEIEEFDD